MPDKPVKVSRGDTLHYQVAFTDRRERERFVYGFERFLKEQSFQTERFDSAGAFIALKILPAAKQPVTSGQESAATAKQVALEQPYKKAAAKDTVVFPGNDTMALPRFAGALRIYVPRGFISMPFTACVNAWPFREKNTGDTSAGYLVVDKVTPADITLKLACKVTNGVGQAVSAIDFISTWTNFIKDHPAEGLALFRWCDGVTDFIKGREALVPGLQAIDNNTVRIKFTTPDPSALDRLRTSRTLPAEFKLGAYFTKVSRETENVLSSNRSAAGTKPFLNECLVRTGGDNNPLVSYSLGRYDALMLSGSADLDYARRILLKDGTCSIIQRDRYFIANNIWDSSARAFIRSVVSGGDLLKNFVKSEGQPIAMIETDGLAGGLPSIGVASKPSFTDPVRIIYRKDDAISKTVADRLLATLTHSGVPGIVAALDEKEYESALVARSYNCVVGWAPESVMNDQSEKLRLATLFFNDETSEALRIAGNREIPLFSIDWYLLAKPKVGLFQGTVSGMYVRQVNK
jgi:hypothetical protein